VADYTKRILIVEDAEDIRASLVELLRDEGYEVLTACNGEDALGLLGASPELPALILLDLMMPVMDGYAFRAAQLRDPKLARIPVVLMSAGGDMQAKVSELGAKGYMRKPFSDLETILAAVAQFT
jgi:CheY-like chemotaxis protein